MARKKPAADTTSGTPLQQGEADILAEVGATQVDNDGEGELQADEEKVRAMGAVDAESVLENRRTAEIVNKIRAGQKGVSFNLDNVLQKYDGLIQTWPPNTLDILVRRVTGTPVQWVIQSRPKSGGELYAAILAHHGRYDEAEYDVRFVDYTSKQKRGTGRIVMPDMRDTPPTQQQPPQQGQPPMNPYYGQPPPQQQPAPAAVQVTAPTVDPMALFTKAFEIFQQMRPQQPLSPPAPSIAPPVQPQLPLTDPMAVFTKAFEMFQKMTVQSAPIAAPTVQPPSTDPMAVFTKAFDMFQKMQPAPSTALDAPPQPTTDPMSVMQESFRLFQQMQPQPQAQTVAAPPPPAGSDPSAVMAWMLQRMQQPQVPSIDPMVVFTKAFEMFERMQKSAVSAPTRSQEPGGYPSRSYVRPGERPYYAGPQQGDPRYPGGGGYQPPYQQQPQRRPKTAAEEFKDAASVIDMAMSIADRFRPPAAEPEPDRREDDDNPVRVVKVGDHSLILDKKSGAPRWGETGIANAGNVFKWLAEQREEIMKAAERRQAKERRESQPLPEGYVEVGPGYKPPPGFVAVPVGIGPGLPEPPEDMPPPIQDEEPPPPRRWGAPPMPGGGG